jgi:hypothetical protein
MMGHDPATTAAAGRRAFYDGLRIADCRLALKSPARRTWVAAWHEERRKFPFYAVFAGTTHNWEVWVVDAATRNVKLGTAPLSGHHDSEAAFAAVRRYEADDRK